MSLKTNDQRISNTLKLHRGGLVSLLRRITIGIFFATILMILLSTFFYLYWQYQRDVVEVRKELTAQTKEAMRQQVDWAVEFIDYARENLGWSKDRTQGFVKKRIEQISYADGQGYIFVDNYQGVILAHPSKDLVGQDMWELEDVNGVKIAQELVAEARRGGGFVSYAWLHPITKKQEEKLTYVRSVDDWQWVVCSGLYLVDVDRAVAARHEKLRSDLARHAAIVLCVAAISFVLIIICLLRISRRVGDELRNLESGMIAGSSAHGQITPEAFHVREFEIIAAGLKEAFSQVEYATDKLKREQEVVQTSEQQLRATNQQLSANQQQLRAANQQLRANELEREGFVSTLKYKNRELQDIVYTTSHDLRSPLVNIEGFSGELHSDCEKLAKMIAEQDNGQDRRQQIEALLKENVPESLRFITGSVKKMSSLLNGLLQVSRVGTVEISSQPIDMNKTMGEVLAAIEYQIQENNITVKVETLDGCTSDPNLVNTVFSNLVGNAIKYCDPANEGEIRISSEIENGMSVYCVQDNGIGIKAEYQGKVFEIFHRLDPDDDIEGEGLGLTIVTRIMNRLGGKIWLDSEPGKGSKFFIALDVN